MAWLLHRPRPRGLQLALSMGPTLEPILTPQHPTSADGRAVSHHFARGSDPALGGCDGWPDGGLWFRGYSRLQNTGGRNRCFRTKTESSLSDFAQTTFGGTGLGWLCSKITVCAKSTILGCERR